MNKNDLKPSCVFEQFARINMPKPGVPESFKVLIKELQSLCLDMRVLDKDGNEIELKDDDDDGYQPVREDYYDRDEEFTYQKDAADFAAAGGFSFKESSDDDDLTLESSESAVTGDEQDTNGEEF